MTHGSEDVDNHVLQFARAMYVKYTLHMFVCKCVAVRILRSPHIRLSGVG
jgi:hypothetical protein